MFNGLIKELIIDVNVPLRLAVRGMFVYEPQVQSRDQQKKKKDVLE
jgi:hypothetical protein